MNRRDARQAALCMIFDYSFHSEEKAEEILELYIENFRDEENKSINEELRNDDYFTKVYFGVIASIPALDEIITKCSKKWNIRFLQLLKLS
jgi:transcription termination factor NusB